jgi:FkbM family methyltransferase
MTDQELQRFLQESHNRQRKFELRLLGMQQSIAALEADAILRATGRSPRMLVEFTAQYGEDMFAWKLLGRSTSGFFIEGGAFDGYHFSTTYALEAMGWTGLLVEAIPDRSRECAARRLHSRVVNAALSSSGATGDADFWIVDDPYGGMLSYSTLTPQHDANVGTRARTKVSVPRATLDHLLAEHQGQIDLVVLDIEGDELAALNGFDIKRWRPRLLIIEDNSRGQNQALKDHMQSCDYQLGVRLAVNDIYIRRDQAALFEQLKWILLKDG